VPQDVQ
jgi:hypothetical protein